jgi:hypothetical protein
MAREYLFAFLVVLVVLVIWYLATWNNEFAEDYLTGVWCAQEQGGATGHFCDGADIGNMMLVVGPAQGRWRTRTRDCFLIVDDICAQAVEISYARARLGMGVDSYAVSCKCDFAEDDVWPERINIRVDPLVGLMWIEDFDGVVQAKLAKDHELSAECV